ncbi:hypothetical protein [Xenophilus sp. Marseille-Q4582]|nr:hypothetical protein [Xenophilus sp. Marseille-Q4582]
MATLPGEQPNPEPDMPAQDLPHHSPPESPPQPVQAPAPTDFPAPGVAP